MGELLAARWLLSASLTFALLSGSRALTPPNCPVIKGEPTLVVLDHVISLAAFQCERV